MRYAVIFFVLLIAQISSAQKDIPFGYELIYSQNFSSKESLNDFRFADPDQWSYMNDKSGSYLELSKKGDYNPAVRSPRNICLLNTVELGEFIMDVSLKQTGKDNDHRDMVVIFGFRDSLHYYYAHLAPTPDSNACNVFVVNGEPRENLLPVQDAGIRWQDDQWHTIRLKRDIVKTTIEVYFDDMTTPVFKVKDRTFIKGFVGFGSFDDPGQIDNIKIWSYTAISNNSDSFSKKEIEQ